MSTVIVNSTNFQKEVNESTTPVLVDFYADWCGPCRMIGPALESVASKYAGKVKVCKLDVDASPDVAARFGVQSIPTVMLLKNGKLVDHFMGAIPQLMIENFLAKHIG